MPLLNDITVRLKQGGVCSPHDPLPGLKFTLNIQWGVPSSHIKLSREHPMKMSIEALTIEEVEYLAYCLLKKIQEVRSETAEYSQAIQSQEAGPAGDVHQL